jgi:hypothetical protein
MYSFRLNYFGFEILVYCVGALPSCRKDCRTAMSLAGIQKARSRTKCAGSTRELTYIHVQARRFAAQLALHLLFLSAATLGVSSDSTHNETPLHTIQQIRHLKADVLSKGPEVRVRAVVTYSDSVAPNLFVQDSTGGIWVDLRGMPGKMPRPGQDLDLRGQARSGFAPYIAQPYWTVIGSAAEPKPMHLSYEDASTGSFDSQWVEMDGVVRSFIRQVEGNVLVVDVATPSGSFKVRIPNYQAEFPMQWVDAKVRFRGVCGTAFNRRNQLVTIHLFVPSLRDSEVLQPASSNPFDVPATPIGEIRKFSADLSDIHRIKVLGTVTAIFPGEGLYLMDSTGGLYAQSQDGTPAKPGDEVEVIGFPAHRHIYADAAVRKISPHPKAL